MYHNTYLFQTLSCYRLISWYCLKLPLQILHLSGLSLGVFLEIKAVKIIFKNDCQVLMIVSTNATNLFIMKSKMAQSQHLVRDNDTLIKF